MRSKHLFFLILFAVGNAYGIGELESQLSVVPSSGGTLVSTTSSERFSNIRSTGIMMGPVFLRDGALESLNRFGLSGSLQDKPTCCTGPEAESNPLCAPKDVCSAFPGAIASSVDSDVSKLIDLIAKGHKEQAIPIPNIKNACQSCYAKAFEVSESSKDFNSERKTLEDAMNVRIAKQQVTKAFQALHSYNDSLFRFYGLHADKLDYATMGLDKTEALSLLTCSDADTIMQKIKDPNGACKETINSFKNSSDFEAYINSQTDWFKNSIGKNASAGNTFESMLSDYLQNFNKGHLRTENSCTTRTMHGRYLAARFYSKADIDSEGKERAESISDLVFNKLDELVPREDLNDGGSINDYCQSSEKDIRLPVALLHERLVASIPETTSEDEKSKIVEEVQQNFAIAVYREPTLNLMLNSKVAFCDHYVNPRMKNPSLDSRSVFENIYKPETSPYSLFEMVKAATKNCAPLYESLVDNICNPAQTDIAGKGQIEDAVSFIRDNYNPNGIGDTEKNLLLNSIVCEKGGQLEPSNTDVFIGLNSKIYLSSPYTPDSDGNIFFKDKEYSSRVNLMVDIRGDRPALLSALDNYDLFNTAAFNEASGKCDGINLSKDIARFYQDISGDESYALSKMNYEGKIIGVKSSSDTSEVDMIDEIADLAAANMTHTAVVDDEKLTESRNETRLNISSGKLGIMYGGRSSGIGGGASSRSETVVAGTGLTGRDIAEQAKVQTAEVDDTVYSMPESDGLSSMDRLMQESQRASAMYERTKQRYSGARENILNDSSLNPSDVASAVSTEPEIQESFDELRDKVAKATGVSESEANNKLVNALAGSEDSLQSELGSEKSNAQLLAEIEQLKAEIAAAKRKGDAKSVKDSSDEYIAELENRIKELESGEARSRKSSQGRTPASTKSGSGAATSGPVITASGRNNGFVSSMVNPTPTASQAAANILGNLSLVRNIIDNPSEFIKSGDFNISLKDNQLFLKVEKKDINEPIEISSYSVDSNGQLTAIEFPGRKAISVAALSSESKQALQSYVEKYPELVTQAQETEIAAIKKEMKKVKEVRAIASEAVENPDDASVYAELVCSLDSDDKLCQN